MQICLVRPVWMCLEENHWISCGERAKRMLWDMLVILLQACGNGSCSCWTTWHWSWVLQKCRSSVPSLNHTYREVCVVSLATFTIPVCRWIASETNPADEPSRSKCYRPRMHSDAEQYETSTTELTPDSELFTVLSAEAARVAGEGVQPRKPSRVRSSH